MKISAIVAMGKNRVIGKDNSMMWNIPSETEFYRSQVRGHFYIMGRRNFEGSMDKHNNEKVLILSSKNLDHYPQKSFYHLGEEINYAYSSGERELFILGGGQVYENCLPYLTHLYLSVVDFYKEGDVYFPDYTKQKWEEVFYFKKNMDDRTPLPWEFYLLKNLKPQDWKHLIDS